MPRTRAVDRVPKGPLVAVVLRTREHKKFEFIRTGKEGWYQKRPTPLSAGMFDVPRFAAYLGLTESEIRTVMRLSQPSSTDKNVDFTLVDKVYTALGLAHQLMEDYPLEQTQQDKE